MKRLLFALLALSTLLLAGCGGGTTQKPTGGLDFIKYPIETDETLTYWMPLNPNVAQSAVSLGDTPFGKQLMKDTGIKIDFIHPPAGQEGEQWGLMMTSSNLPDLFLASWLNYSKALDDGVLIPLNDLIESDAPNFKKYLADNPEIDKLIRREDGFYDCIPFIRGDESLLSYYGPMLRGDWLEDLGLDVPETIDEWYNVLTRFKNEKNAEAPLSYVAGPMFGFNEFIGAFGISVGFFVEDGKIVYGSADPRYKDFLTEFAKWYAEGLIDANIANVDDKTLDTNILTNKTGATCSWGTWNKWATAGQEKDPRFKLVPAPHVTLVKGTVPEFGQKDGWVPGDNCVGITRSCKNPKLAMRFLDYAFSEEGYNLYNFGIKGESYNIVDGEPVFTDLILNNPDDLSPGQAMGRYMMSSYGGPFVQARQANDQNYPLPEQKKALEIWPKVNTDAHRVPKFTFAPDEQDEYTAIMGNVNTLASEMMIKFIMGIEPMDNFDKYISDLKRYNIERVIEILQAAYDRYISAQ